LERRRQTTLCRLLHRHHHRLRHHALKTLQFPNAPKWHRDATHITTRLPDLASRCHSPHDPQPVFASRCHSPHDPQPVFASRCHFPHDPQPVLVSPCHSPRDPRHVLA